jgi:hypothetical protein
VVAGKHSSKHSALLYNEQMTAQLLRDIQDEVIQLLFNRYVFRTHQEIVRRNPKLQGHPQSIFHEWAWIVYGVANAIGIRRLAGGTYQEGDVSLVRLFDILIRDSSSLWNSFNCYHPAKPLSQVAWGGNPV